VSTAFSVTLHEALLNLRGRGGGKKGRGTFPAEIAGQDLRVRDEEPADDWFRRIVNDCLAGDVERCRIEDNLALFLQLAWGHDRIHGVRCQAFAVVGGTLAEVYDGDSSPTRYLRFDYDKDEFGEVFSHPFPHVHAQPDDAPRFPLRPSDPRLALIEFFEFLYLSFNHRVWLEWAKAAVKDLAALIEELIALIRGSYEVEAKRNAIRGFVASRRAELARVMRSLRDAKREMPFAWELDLDEWEHLNYLG
jgi:hypothetical protein